MSATEEAVVAEGPRAPTLLDNPNEAIADIISKREASPDAQPATPAEPAAPVANWRDLVVDGDDVPVFYRGQKGSDVIKSLQHTQATLKEAQQRAADSTREVEQLRRDREADLAALRVQQRREADPEPLAADPDEDFAVFTASEVRKLAQTIVAAEITKYQQATETQVQTSGLLSQGEKAFADAQAELGLDTKTWHRRAKAVMHDLTDPQGEYHAKGGPLVKENYLAAYKELYGDIPTSASVTAHVTPAPKAPNPPGSKSVTVTQHERTLPTVSGEKTSAAESIARAMGLSTENAARLYTRKERNA